MSWTNGSSVAEFYRDRNVLVTGGTGFLGKVLVEKLLRSCPQIGNIYLLIRPRRGLTPGQRLESLMQQEVFSRMHQENSTARNKVVVVEGDLADPNFTLNERDEELLANVVSVVFHSAATIKFDEELKYAIKTNIAGTKHMLDLAKKMKDLKAFVHISTAYSCNRTQIKEEYYAVDGPKHFWKDLITAADKISEYELNALTPRILGNLPNTYTFTKHVGESMVYDYKDQLPIVIYRPSIVMSAFYEPIPGWVDNLNGPIGMITGVYTGITRLLQSTPETKNDYIGVDFVVNGAIVVGAHRQIQNLGECPVYNCSAGDYSLNFGDNVSRMLEIQKRIPTEKTVWKPKVNYTTSFAWFELHFLLFTVLPAACIDLLFKIRGVKFSAVKACRKVLTVCRILKHFSMTTYDIKHDKLRDLYRSLSPEDKRIFNFDMEAAWEDRFNITETTILGIKRYILKDDMSDKAIQNLRKRTKYFDWMDKGAHGVFYAFVAYLMWSFSYPYFHNIISNISYNNYYIHTILQIKA